MKPAKARRVQARTDHGLEGARNQATLAWELTDRSAAPARVRLGEDDGRAALLVDGVVQSIAPADGANRGGYWAAMLPAFRPRRALILGLGGGTLANLLHQRWGAAVPIVGVDASPAVLALAREAGWLRLAELDLVQQDAFVYVQFCTDRFDYAALDLYDGREFVGRALTRPFLRRLAGLLIPPGLLVVNLFDDNRTAARLARLARVFAIEREQRVGDNVVVHAHVRR